MTNMLEKNCSLSALYAWCKAYGHIVVMRALNYVYNRRGFMWSYEKTMPWKLRIMFPQMLNNYRSLLVIMLVLMLR